MLSWDPCIECGFARRSALAHPVALAARQRIVLYRELAAAIVPMSPPTSWPGCLTIRASTPAPPPGSAPIAARSASIPVRSSEAAHDKYRRFVPIARWSADHFAGVTRTARGALGLKRIAGKLLGTKRWPDW